VIRPTPDELISAEGRSIPEVIGQGIRYLFVGINPGLWSGATGHHFARPGNRFWPTLHGAGFTPRQLAPDDDAMVVAPRDRDHEPGQSHDRQGLAGLRR